ncbi:MAG: hypothetical protein DHS20C15_05570 [Planctomycetota bacterium]|nr:MAG: hypothetical protein DHS20C15_05570 [Planctomycetota bacterium]
MGGMTEPSKPAEPSRHEAPAPSTRATPQDAASASPEQFQAHAHSAQVDSERAHKLGELAHKHTAQRHAEIHGLFEILGSKRRLFWVNFLAGLSRGIGFFLGVTLVGGMLIGAMALAFDFVASTLGLKELRFSSMVAGLAEKYFEAEKVWTSVDSDAGSSAGTDADLGADPDGTPQEMVEPLEDG